MKLPLLALFFFVTMSASAHIDTLNWQRKSSLPDPMSREAFGHFIIDSAFYIVGGYNQNSTTGKQVWRYDITSDRWQQMSDFPDGPIGELSGFSINGMGYICCGIDSLTGYNTDNKLWQYNPVSDTWQRKADFPGWPREGPTTFVYAGKAYVGLGYIGLVDNDLWRYDPILDHWDMMDSLPAVGLFNNGVSIIDSFAYMVNGEANNYVCLKNIWRYSILRNQWDSIGMMPGIGRSEPLCWGFKSHVISILGLTADTFGVNLRFINEGYSYDLHNNTSDTIICQNFLDSVAGGAAFVFGQKAYFFGGYRTVNPNLSFYKDMWSFDANPFLLTGIADPKPDKTTFSLYPNPISTTTELSVNSPEAGEVLFYNTLGQDLYTIHIEAGINKVSAANLQAKSGIILYRATLHSGKTENGRVVVGP